MEELDKKFTSVIASKAFTNMSVKQATQIYGTSEQVNDVFNRVFIIIYYYYHYFNVLKSCKITLILG